MLFQPKSREFELMLRKELEWVNELNELEPQNKCEFCAAALIQRFNLMFPSGILATLILLMRLIDFRGFKLEMSDALSKLIHLDPNRTNYYLDLRKNLTMEVTMEGRSGNY